MPAPVNSFKRALTEGRRLIGLWVALAERYPAEMLAGAGFDWLLIDGEHAPNDVRSLSDQFHAISSRPGGAHAVVRPPIGDPVRLKLLLDAGVQTFLIPMVETAEEARALVRATRYPPQGIRGVGAALGRASDFGAIGDYASNANEEICLLQQVETPRGILNAREIAEVEGVDGVFIGPSDLAATMGHLGQTTHPEVAAAIARGLADIHAAGKAAGIMSLDEDQARAYLDQGFTFVAVGADVTLLTRAARALAARFKA